MSLEIRQRSDSIELTDDASSTTLSLDLLLSFGSLQETTTPEKLTAIQDLATAHFTSPQYENDVETKIKKESIEVLLGQKYNIKIVPINEIPESKRTPEFMQKVKNGFESLWKGDMAISKLGKEGNHTFIALTPNDEVVGFPN